MKKKTTLFLICLMMIFTIGCNKNAEKQTSETTQMGGRPGYEYSGNNCVMLDDKLYYIEDTIEQNLDLDEAKKYCEDKGYKYIGTVEKTVDGTPKNNFESALSDVGSLIYRNPDSKEDTIILYDLNETYIFQLRHN